MSSHLWKSVILYHLMVKLCSPPGWQTPHLNAKHYIQKNLLTLPGAEYTQTHICTLELTPTHKHTDQGKNSSEVPIWISWPQDLSLIVMLCSDSHDLYRFQFSFQLLFCSTFRVSQGSFIQVYVFWFVSASLCNPPLLKSQGKKNNTQEQNMWLINQILGKTHIFQWNRTKCKELSPWEESQAAQGWRLWVIGLFPLAGSLWIV